MSETAAKKGFFANFKGDLFGGLTAGIVALPLALAFGVQSGLGAPAGLFGAIFIGFFASLFGGTPTQISGPTAPMTAVSMLVIAGIVQTYDGVIADALPSILSVFFLAGLFQIFFGVIKLGSLIKYIPYPVVSGFMTGIGVIILITQLLPLFGYAPAQDQQNINKFKPQAEEILLDKILKDEAAEGFLVLEHFEETVKRAKNITADQIQLEAATLVSKDSSGVLGSLKYLSKAIGSISWLEFLLALATIIIIFGFKKITKAIPSTLVALLVVTIVSTLAGWEPKLIGEIPRGFPKLHLEMFSLSSLSNISPYILTALTLALLGAIDSLLTSVVADNMTKTRHNSEKELIGQGIGNSIASLFGGIPGAGATIRTVVNIDAGGKSKLSGMIAALLLLIVLLLLGPLAEMIPKAVLAGILITVGIGVMDYKGLKALPHMPRADALVLITVLLITVFWDLIIAVGIGLVLASILFMKKMADVAKDKSEVVSLKDEIHGSDMSVPTGYNEEVYVKKIEGPLFFGSIGDFRKLFDSIPKTTDAVVLRMEKVPHMDQSGLNAIEDIAMNLVNQNIRILLCGVEKQPMYLLENYDIVPDLIPTNQIFETFESCVAWIKGNVEDKY